MASVLYEISSTSMRTPRYSSILGDQGYNFDKFEVLKGSGASGVNGVKVQKCMYLHARGLLVCVTASVLGAEFGVWGLLGL